jgi:predicted metal-dependent hydrolase/integrase
MSRIEEYFTQKGLKPKSRQTYMFAFKKFFRYIYGQDAGTDFENLAEKYLTETRDYKKDLIGFIGSLREKPVFSVKSYFGAVIGFLQYNDVEFKQSHMIQIRAGLPKGNRAKTCETELTKEILQSLFAQTTIHSRALYLTLLSSGARIGEILSLELSDLDLTKDPVEIEIRGEYTKTSQRRRVFISQEAAQAIKEWLKVRETYLKRRGLRELSAVHNRPKNRINLEQYRNRIFPFTYRNAKSMFRHMIDKSGFGRVYNDKYEVVEDKNLDRTTMRARIHPHMFRKYFRTYLAAVHVEGINSLDAVEVLMGHEGYLTQSYRRLPESVLRTFYKGAEYVVTVERDRSVVVHVPEGTSDEKIQSIVESKRNWIYEKTRHPQKFHTIPHPPGKELVNGESALYLGRNYQIELRNDISDIQFENRFLIPSSISHEKRHVLQKWYVEKAKEKILPRVKSFASNLGVSFSDAKIVNNRYRWGSCTMNDNVNLNWRLIKAPIFVIDYVIIHELAHFLETNHTPRFWNIVRTQSANTEKAKQWLLEHGQVLEEEI